MNVLSYPSPRETSDRTTSGRLEPGRRSRGRVSSVPYTGARALARLAARTMLARAALAVVLIALVVAAALSARHPRLDKQPLLPPDAGGLLVLDLSASIGSDTFSRIGETLRELVARGGRYGLVVFSTTAYEALPPGTPASALAPLVRYFTLPEHPAAGEQASFPVNPWSRSFSSGTYISLGLDLARRIETEQHVRSRWSFLVSDLADTPNDLSRLNEVLAAYKAAGIRLTVIPLDASEEDLSRFVGAATKIIPASLPGEHPSAAAARPRGLPHRPRPPGDPRRRAPRGERGALGASALGRRGGLVTLGSLVFLTPFGALVAVGLRAAAGGARPRGATRAPGASGARTRVASSRRSRGTNPGPRGRPALLGVAAAQPALRSTASAHVRTDAQAFFVVDVTRSMLASGAPGGDDPARARAQRARYRAARRDPRGAVRDRDPDRPRRARTSSRSPIPASVRADAGPRGHDRAAAADPLRRRGDEPRRGRRARDAELLRPPPARTERSSCSSPTARAAASTPARSAKALAAGPGVHLVRRPRRLRRRERLGRTRARAGLPRHP